MTINTVGEGEGLGEALSPIDNKSQIIVLQPFKKCMKLYGLNENDLNELKNELTIKAPEADLGSHVYKFR